MNEQLRKTKGLLAASMIAVLLSVPLVAYARYVSSYDLFVPRFGGIAYTSSSLTKVTDSQWAVDYNDGISANYHQFAALYRVIGGKLTRVTAEYEIASGQDMGLWYEAGQAVKTSGYKLGHRSKWNTLVTVETWGSWSPDYP